MLLFISGPIIERLEKVCVNAVRQTPLAAISAQEACPLPRPSSEYALRPGALQPFPELHVLGVPAPSVCGALVCVETHPTLFRRADHRTSSGRGSAQEVEFGVFLFVCFWFLVLVLFLKGAFKIVFI